MRALCAVALALSVAAGCGGGGPLLHPAHALPDGELAVTGGFSAQLAVAPARIRDGGSEQALEEGATSPGLAPFVAGRLGLGSGFEGGLAYSGRSARLDGRYAFDFGSTALSLGLGASAVLPKRRGDLDLRASGLGGDVPMVFGWRSSADVYALWIGARGGFERLEGHRELVFDATMPDAPPTEPFEAWHGWGGGLVGFRVGFRHVHAVLELDGAFHYAEGSLGATDASIGQFALAPAGGLAIQF